MKKEFSQFAKSIVEDKYAVLDDDGKSTETLEQVFRRVANGVGETEEQKQVFYDLLYNREFLPNTPAFMGVGTPIGNAAACYVLGIKDDLGKEENGIFATLREAVLIWQAAGGVGFDFSDIRSEGELVSTSKGQATGPIGFLKAYDAAASVTAQGGKRRAACMGILDISHPDVEKFIVAKDKEGDISSFNLSVGISAKFMEAVETNSDFDLVDPHSKKIKKTVNARELFNQIIKHAWKNGEPGIIFFDRINEYNPVPQLGRIKSTNPCVTGDTRVPTDRGLIKIKDLADVGMFTTITGNGNITIAKAQKTKENADVYEVLTKQGYSLKATEDHKIFTPSGKIEVKDLKCGDTILLNSSEFYKYNENVIKSRLPNNVLNVKPIREDTWVFPAEWSFELGQVLGYLVGNGFITDKDRGGVGITFGDEQTYSYIKSIIDKWTITSGHTVRRNNCISLQYSASLYRFFKELGVSTKKATEKTIPTSLWEAPNEAIIGFINGLFSADGTVNLSEIKKSCSVRLNSSSINLLKETQILLSKFACISKIYKRRNAGTRLMPDSFRNLKEYNTSDNYELVIDKKNRDIYQSKIRFIQEYKNNILDGFYKNKTRKSNKEEYTDTITSIEYVGKEDVYDISVDHEDHSFIANGMVIANCGEQPLLPYENCCLGSINLAEHVTDFGTGFNTIDWKKLETTVRNSTRFLDNLIDANKYIPSVPKLKEMALTTRRIGLGIMGLADALFMLKKPYDSSEGRDIAETIMNYIQFISIDESIDIAKEKGAFPAFKGSVWENPDKTFVERWLSQDQIDRIKKYGIRNSSHTTIAPTGTISNVAMAEGGGCEPVFALAYTRRVLDKNQNPIYVRLHSELFVKALRMNGYKEDEIDSILTEVAKTGSCQNVELLDRTPELKKIFVVANDISPDAHVAMQAVLQKWCSSSISKTCNLPFSATEEDVYNIYMKAYEEGCKSITVYRSGSRSMEVLTTEKEEKSEEKEIKNTFKRKFSLHGVTFRKATPVGTSYVTVNHDEDENPVEVFVQVAKAGSEVYAIGEAIGRLSSYILQHSNKDTKKTLKDLSEQLKGIGGSSSVGLGPHRVMSLPDAVGQVFYEYVTGIDKIEEPSIIDTITIGDVCPECGQPSLVNTEGCMKCTNCGYSKC